MIVPYTPLTGASTPFWIAIDWRLLLSAAGSETPRTGALHAIGRPARWPAMSPEHDCSARVSKSGALRYVRVVPASHFWGPIPFRNFRHRLSNRSDVSPASTSIWSDSTPCFSAFLLTVRFPSRVLGPVERRAFRRLAINFFCDISRRIWTVPRSGRFKFEPKVGVRSSISHFNRGSMVG